LKCTIHNSWPSSPATQEQAPSSSGPTFIEPPGEPGVDAGKGGVQLIRIRIADMTIEGEVGELPSYLYDGSLAVGTAIQDNIVPLPAIHSEPIRLSMTLSEDARVLTLSGSSATIAPEGEFQYVERFKP
jgi:hypothetical protein